MSEDYNDYEEEDEDNSTSSTSDDNDEQNNILCKQDTEESEESEEEEGIESHSDESQISFTGDGFDCTCSGGCLCKYYEKKSTYNTDCVYCGHPLSYHRKR